jgi:heme/copper-type cytochrome/quinol oxidase subunit 4
MKKMNKVTSYVTIWGLMVAATLVEIYIFTTTLSAQYKVSSILALAIAQAITNAAFFQNLRYEKKVIALLPILSIVVLCTLLITAILSVGR